MRIASQYYSHSIINNKALQIRFDYPSAEYQALAFADLVDSYQVRSGKWLVISGALRAIPSGRA